MTQQNLRTGTGLTLDVLQAQDAAEKAQLRRATAMVRYNQSQINLLAALGLVDQTDIGNGPHASGAAAGRASERLWIHAEVNHAGAGSAVAWRHIRIKT